MTIGGVLLVDRKGRKFLLSIGSAGIIVSLVCTGMLFRRTESLRVDVRDAVQSMVTPKFGRKTRSARRSRCSTTRRLRMDSSQRAETPAGRSATARRRSS